MAHPSSNKVLIFDVENKDELYSALVSELRRHNIKYRKDKISKASQDKGKCRRIFNAALHTQELTDVILANGGIVQIPLFVSNACQFILEKVNSEGLFRKTGSAKRQREIRASLEAGEPLGRSYDVFDVANLLKTFFRDLPEPLLPCGNIQEALLRCLIGEQKVQKLLMTCLLLPSLTLNTLAFFMQFLHTVSQHSAKNKMTIKNLAILITPNLMPFEQDQKRMASNQQVVQLLIENSQQIGLIPEVILRQLKDDPVAGRDASVLMASSVTDRKKKKRRSGSLTRMFNGFRKIVGAIGSSENLDKTDELSEPDPTGAAMVMGTPCLSKSAKKRKVTDGIPFSVKKKEVKKSRLSLGGGKKSSKMVQRLLPSGSIPSIAENKPMERRWSVVGAPWGRKKQQTNRSKQSTGDDTETTDPSGAKTEDEFEPDEEDKALVGRRGGLRMSPVISMPCLTGADGLFKLGATSRPTDEHDGSEDFLNIRRSEYEAIKHRMDVIETTISQEFRNLGRCDEDVMLEDVEDQYRQTLEHTEPIEATCSSTDQLAKRLSRELKIRPNGEHKVIRSPSARKIGTIRRRSREAVRLSRNQSWHIGNGGGLAARDGNATVDLSFYPKPTVLKRGRHAAAPAEVEVSALPIEASPAPLMVCRPPKQNKLEHSPAMAPGTNFTDEEKEEKWMNAESYFEQNNVTPTATMMDTTVDFLTPAKTLSQDDTFRTPEKSSRRSSLRSASRQPPSSSSSSSCYVTRIEVNAQNPVKTPMLPPVVPPRPAKTPGRTPRLPPRTPSSTSCNGTVGGGMSSMLLKTHMTPLQEAQSGRASIARIRSQNAGMVAAKAKLFDGMVSGDTQPGDSTKRTLPTTVNMVNRRQSAKFRAATVAIPLAGSPLASDTQLAQLRQIQRLRSASAHSNKPRSPRSTTPRKRAFTKSAHHHPGGTGAINRREKLRQIAKGPAGVVGAGGVSAKVLNSPRLMRQLQENVLQQQLLMANGCHSPSSKTAGGISSSTTPHIRHQLLRNSPRRILAATPHRDNRTATVGERLRTPMKATPLSRFSIVHSTGGGAFTDECSADDRGAASPSRAALARQAHLRQTRSPSASTVLRT
uniref:Uncharacterized protein n=1 Tax=Anopheles albimanus TaxID=7167 RepID=A0A182FQB1_ANOAL